MTLHNTYVTLLYLFSNKMFFVKCPSVAIEIIVFSKEVWPLFITMYGFKNNLLDYIKRVEYIYDILFTSISL